MNLSQEELTARLQVAGFDISRGMLSHWETGRNSLPLDNPEFVNALAEALNMSVLDILIQSGYAIQLTPKSREALRAAIIVDQLPELDKDFAIDMLESLLAKSRR